MKYQIHNIELLKLRRERKMIGLIFAIAMLAGMWKVFEKAGMEGWKGIIPIYNVYLMITEIAKKPAWWIVLLFIPGV